VFELVFFAQKVAQKRVELLTAQFRAISDPLKLFQSFEVGSIDPCDIKVVDVV
jgi:hypothetical protein